MHSWLQLGVVVLNAVYNFTQTPERVCLCLQKILRELKVNLQNLLWIEVTNLFSVQVELLLLNGFLRYPQSGLEVSLFDVVDTRACFRVQQTINLVSLKHRLVCLALRLS